MKYRLEIDGLRAISVLAIVFYHAEFVSSGSKTFQGGYIGVDIFFVISGYLITSIILNDLRNRKFSFVKFYERRVRRLFPVLLIVMLVSIPFAWMSLHPKAMMEYSKSILLALFFSSNFWFYSQDSYFAELNELKPFLHTWSLSVEGQFYILFPILLLLLYKLCKKHIVSVFLISGLLSLMFAKYLHLNSPEFTYFLLPTRVWELLAGAILAKMEEGNNRAGHPVMGKFAPPFGVCLIFYAIIFFDGQKSYSYLMTLIPVFGAMLFIWFAKKGELVTDILSSKVLVGIGLISYSFYLWHFPVLALLKIKGITASDYDKMGWLVLAFFLSFLTYKFIEKPSRNSSFSLRSLLLLLSMGLILMGGFALGAIYTSGYSSRTQVMVVDKTPQPFVVDKTPQPFVVDKIPQPYFINKTIAGEPCYGNTKFCEFNSSEDSRDVMLIGDSILESIAPYLYPELNKIGFNLVTLNSSGCYFMPGFYSVGSGYYPCTIEYQNLRLEEIYRRPGAIIIIGGMLDYHLENETVEKTSKWSGLISDAGYSYSDAYVSNINKLLEKGYVVVQLAPHPRAKMDVSKAVFDYANRQDYPPILAKLDLIQLLSYKTETYFKNAKQSFGLFEKIKHENYSVISLHTLFCNTLLQDHCVFNDGKEIYLIDASHPAKKGAQMISSLIASTLQKM